MDKRGRKVQFGAPTNKPAQLGHFKNIYSVVIRNSPAIWAIIDVSVFEDAAVESDWPVLLSSCLLQSIHFLSNSFCFCFPEGPDLPYALPWNPFVGLQSFVLQLQLASSM